MRTRLVSLLFIVFVVGPAAVKSPAPAEAGAQRVTLEFKDAELGDVLHMLSRQCGTSIVLGGNVEGTITANLVDVPFGEALRIILSPTGYKYYWKDGAVVIDSRQMESRVVSTQFVDAREIVKTLASFVSEGGMIKAFEEQPTSGVSGNRFSSKLIIVDREGHIDELVSMVEKIDVAPVQVMIEAKIVETTLGDEEKLGLKWNISGSISGASAPTTFPFPKKTSDNTDVSATPDPGDKSLFIKSEFPDGEYFPFAQPEDFLFGRVSATEFSMILEALSERRNTNLVSNPKVATLNNKPAEILVGKQIPVALYERQKETGVLEIIGYDQQKVGVSLWVTPHVGSDGMVLLEIEPEASTIVEFIGQFNERPITSTRVARTQVIVKDGETVVIGGLISEVDRRIDTRVPLLGSIPILGRLFRHKSIEKQKVDLLIFITPRLATH